MGNEIMSFLKRIYLYIIRNKQQSLQYVFLFGIILFLANISISAYIALDSALFTLKNETNAYFSISKDTEWDGDSTILDDTLIHNIFNIDGIKAYNGTNLFYLNTKDFKLLPGKFTGIDEEKAGITRVICNHYSQWNELFFSGQLKLMEGRHINAHDNGKTIISRAVAAENSLSIGDNIRLEITEEGSFGTESAIGWTTDQEVVGIFELQKKEQEDSDKAERDNIDNFILTDVNTGKNIFSQIFRDQEFQYKQGLIFLLEDADDTLLIKKTIEESVNTEGLGIKENTAVYKNIRDSMDKLASYIQTFMIFIVVSGIIITGILMGISFEERVYEMGILLSIGYKKKEIMLQFILEKTVIFFTAVILALPISLGLIKTVNLGLNKFLQSSTKETSVVTGIKMNINLWQFIVMTGAGLLLVSCVTVIGGFTILRKKPREIMLKAD